MHGSTKDTERGSPQGRRGLIPHETTMQCAEPFGKGKGTRRCRSHPKYGFSKGIPQMKQWRAAKQRKGVHVSSMAKDLCVKQVSYTNQGKEEIYRWETCPGQNKVQPETCLE